MAELEFDPPSDERTLEFDGPQSGGAFAAKELAPGQAERGERLRRLMNLVEARGEPGYGERLKDSFGMGLTRPISGAVAAIGDKIAGRDISAGDSYRAQVGAEEDYIARANKNTNPYAGAAVDVIGSLATGGPASSLVRGGATVAQQAPTTGAKIGKALMSSTGSGAIEGAARNSEDVGSAAIGAGVGGTIGKAATLIGEPVKKGASAIVDALQDRLSSKAAKAAVSEADRMGGSEAVKEASSTIFDKLNKAGIHFSGKETTELANKVNAVTAGPLPASVRGEIDEVVQDINRRVQNGAMTFGDVRAVQSDISKLKANNNPDVRRVAGDMSNAVDDFFDTAKPTMPASSVGTVGPNDLTEAKDLWRRGSQAEKAEYLAEKGSLVTPDTANKVRTNFGGEVDKVKDPDRYSKFQSNPGLVRQMEEIAAGEPSKAGTAKELNRWSNNLLGYGTIGSAGGLAALGTLNDPYGISSTTSSAGLLAMAAGLAGKKGSGAIRDIVADKGAERVNTLIRNIVTGSAAQPATKNVPREALARLLAEEQLKRGVSRYSSSFYDKE